MSFFEVQTEGGAGGGTLQEAYAAGGAGGGAITLSAAGGALALDPALVANGVALRLIARAFALSAGSSAFIPNSDVDFLGFDPASGAPAADAVDGEALWVQGQTGGAAIDGGMLSADGGAGGPLWMLGADGGPAAGSGAGGQGGYAFINGGVGGAGSATGAPGAGGDVDIFASAGGASGGFGDGLAPGGGVFIGAGYGGFGGNNDGGDVVIDAGGGTGSGSAGDISIGQNVTSKVKIGSQVQVADGSKAFPAVAYLNDPTSGWYRVGAGDHRFSLGNSDLLFLDALEMYVANTNASGAYLGAYCAHPSGKAQFFVINDTPTLVWFQIYGSSVAGTLYGLDKAELGLLSYNGSNLSGFAFDLKGDVVFASANTEAFRYSSSKITAKLPFGQALDGQALFGGYPLETIMSRSDGRFVMSNLAADSFVGLNPYNGTNQAIVGLCGAGGGGALGALVFGESDASAFVVASFGASMYIGTGPVAASGGYLKIGTNNILRMQISTEAEAAGETSVYISGNGSGMKRIHLETAAAAAAAGHLLLTRDA